MNETDPIPNPPTVGSVALVGAGPGDPGLLTVRGQQLLSQAQTVVYDFLSNPALLRHCPQATAIYVGKKASAHSVTQAEINALLVEQARAGHRVVRLKGGDPFVFGRGGEECEALIDAGIPFEVVPGITAAIAAPAYAGIPVTHRDFNSSFTFVTGHEKEQTYRDEQSLQRDPGEASDLDWKSLAALPCLAFYMGVKSLPRICAKLIENGMDPATPAATIRWGATPRQRTVTGTLRDLPQRVAEAGIGPPAMTIIGKVVSLRDRLNWFERRPLFGKSIVVPRARTQASEMAQRLEQLGAEVIEAPTIELVAPADWSDVDDSLGRMADYDWIIFTSASGVAAVRQRLMALGKDARAFGGAKLAAIGDATAAAIREQLFLGVSLCPESFVAEALADAFAARDEIRGRRFLLPRADIARPMLSKRLREGGAAEVRDVAVYETHMPSALPEALIEALAQRRVHWIAFTSSSTARNLATMLGDDYRETLAGINLASIGPITSATLKELGLTVHAEAKTYTTAGLEAAIVAACGGLREL